MTVEEYLEEFKRCTDQMLAITTAKNKDYSGASANPFRNFEAVSNLDIASAEQGFLVRMTDKLMRINNIIKSGEQHVKDESVEDTLLDLANYSILLRCYLISKKEQ